MTSTSSRDDWTRPGVFEVAEGVYRVPLPLPNDGLRAVNVYVVEADGGPVVIDSGWAITEARTLLDRGLKSLGHTLGDISRFLITHVHRDHYTQAVNLRREFGIRVSLGIGERPSLEIIQQPGGHPFAPQLQLLPLLGASSLADEIQASLGVIERGDRDDWAGPDDWLTAEPVSVGQGRSLSVVETPGHTQGHVVFHDESAALLFTGDHVLPTITPSVGFEPVLSANPLGSFLESLVRVRQLPDALLLPAHGGVAPSVHARVDELLAHHDLRLDETLAATRSGAETGLEVASQLRWTRRAHRLSDLDPFNQMLALAETSAHLDLLIAQGRVSMTTEAAVRRYAPAA